MTRNTDGTFKGSSNIHREKKLPYGIKLSESRAKELKDLNIVNEFDEKASEFKTMNQYVNHLISMDLIKRSQV